MSSLTSTTTTTPTPTQQTQPTSALLLIDVQNDFLPPHGSLAVSKGEEVVPVICGLLSGEWMRGMTGEEQAGGAGWDWVVVSQDWHPPTHISFSSRYKHPHAIRTRSDSDDHHVNDKDEDSQSAEDLSSSVRPYTTIRVPKDVLGEHYEIFGPSSSSASSSSSSSSSRQPTSANGATNQSRLANDGSEKDELKEEAHEEEEQLVDPLRGYKVHPEGTDDGQVDLNLWPDHCVQNTPGAELADGLKRPLRPWFDAGRLALVRKGTILDREAFSAFSGHVLPQGSDEVRLALGLEAGRQGVVVDQGKVEKEAEEEEGDLTSFLVGQGVRRVCLVGLAMDYCVAQTALAALNKPSSPFSVYIYTPAVRGVEKGTTGMALRVCEERGIGLLRNEEEVREVFGNGGGRDL